MLRSQFQERLVEAGCDEVGRGCLAGSVVAAAVILPKDFTHPTLTDSKKLSDKNRTELEPIIKEEAIAWAVAEASHEEIDEINILNASYLAMHRSLDQLKVKPEFLVIDGNRFKPYRELPYQCVIKGDSQYLSVAAASILAKTYRDRIMKKLAMEYPGYGWETNVGYPTSKHRLAIKTLGITPIHRRSFQLLPAQTKLFTDID